MAEAALAGQLPDAQSGLRLLTDPGIELLPLLQAAFRVRFHHFGRGVRIHILNNVQNGYCSEDCNYCAQAKNSKAPIEKYSIKSDEEILEGARKAYESGAYRYCMVSSGRSPHAERIDHMSKLIREIKSRWPVEVCLSAGFLDANKARELKEAGLDRYNHNLNTADGYYGSICTTHSYGDRLNTLQEARRAGLEVCSGIIIGMGEKPEEIVEVATTLRSLQARSIPVNFYVHVEGAQLGAVDQLTPAYALRALALFRFFNPDAEVRAAGGRESNLRGMESMALYPANSLFAEGYLNTTGHMAEKTVKMVEDAGFFVEKIEEE
ncbi:biotin synthase [Magnetococcus marinus MC-1]|uniref:Biotin synthase n=2 Tax=Magnetococcus TaxID=162171 RepID=BIOB_MAGMM|nr:RecName: Full=Biotin synthase [Magnetococcus marinus MC-1]ABK42563.1 biotin synthase [Magnetococcus marinus MC-1]